MTHSPNMTEHYLIFGAALLLFSVIASKAIGKVLGFPSLIVFLLVGILAGSEGVGGFYFDNAGSAQILGVIALIYILFAGGINTHLKEVQPVLLSGVSLATLGAFLTCIFVGIFAHFALHFTWLESFLLGAIISPTDSAAVFTVLREKQVSVKGQLIPLLEIESGSNDPISVLLTIGVLSLISDPSASPWALIPILFQKLIVGCTLGFVCGKGTAYFLNHVKLQFEGLYPVMSLALVVLTYGLTEQLGGNGFLGVYVAGLLMSQANFVHKKSLIQFHDGIAWLMQIAMFLALGLLVFPSKLWPVALAGVLVSIFLMVFARPVAVFIALSCSQLKWREKALLSFVGLRGSVPIILALYPYQTNFPEADKLFHLVFFIVITSVLVQSNSIPRVARFLKLDAPRKNKFKYPIEYVPTGDLKNELVEIEVPRNSKVVGKAIIHLSLPKELLIVLIQRQGALIVPRGGTHIENEDKLLVLASPKTLNEFRELLNTESTTSEA